MVTRLQRLGTIAVSIDEAAVPGKNVDQMLIEFARLAPGLIVTTDAALARVADIQKIGSINMNELANALKPALVPGESLSVKLVRAGAQPGPAVGYLDDGTMVVAENGAPLIGQRTDLTVTSLLQTSAGRLIFGKPAESPREEPVRKKDHQRALGEASARNGADPSQAAPETVPTDASPSAAADGNGTVSDQSPAEPGADLGNGVKPTVPPARTPFPPNPPRSVREGSPRNPRR
jgi:hypothetical protein